MTGITSTNLKSKCYLFLNLNMTLLTLIMTKLTLKYLERRRHLPIASATL